MACFCVLCRSYSVHVNLSRLSLTLLVHAGLIWCLLKPLNSDMVTTGALSSLCDLLA